MVGKVIATAPKSWQYERYIKLITPQVRCCYLCLTRQSQIIVHLLLARLTDIEHLLFGNVKFDLPRYVMTQSDDPWCTEVNL